MEFEEILVLIENIAKRCYQPEYRDLKESGLAILTVGVAGCFNIEKD